VFHNRVQERIEGKEEVKLISSTLVEMERALGEEKTKHYEDVVVVIILI
jgi:hypothetical protein